MKYRVPVVLLAAAVAALALGGPLNPPPGPVASTQKTLAEVQPRTAIGATTTPGDADSVFRISQPGSYYLTANVIGVAGKSGIEVASHDVTIDLMGFQMIGTTGSHTGIRPDIARQRIVIRNGGVNGWGVSGIDLTAGGTNSGVACVVESVVASFNIGEGINVGSGSAVRDCTASANSQTGILVAAGCTVSHCTASDNTASGIVGFQYSIADCSALRNGDDGIQVQAGSANNCTAGDNSRDGFWLPNDTAATACSAYANQRHGFLIGGASSLVGCTASDNTAAGFNASASTITNCSARSNQDGIVSGSGSTISGCVFLLNIGHGIQVSSDCLVMNCESSQNGTSANLGAGIKVTGTGNVIEGNNLNRNRIGLSVTGTRAFITRNHCRGNLNLNYEIAANNNFGPILDRTTSAAAPMTGNSAPTNLNTTDAHANFAY